MTRKRRPGVLPTRRAKNHSTATNSKNTSEAQRQCGMLTAALTYAAQGWPVFPCSTVDKRPLTPHGFKDATTDEQQIRRWYTEDFPNAMIGIPMGPKSGVFAVDWI